MVFSGYAYGLVEFIVCFGYLSCSSDMSCDAGDTCEPVPASQSCTSLAVVPYDDGQVSSLHRPERSFKFSEHAVSLEQNWREVGVAAVVWDAVRDMVYSFLHKQQYCRSVSANMSSYPPT